MTDRLSDISERMETVRQLGAVVTAMRGLAAARQHEAEGRLDAIRAYAATVGNAIGEALTLSRSEPARAVASADGHLVILLSAEQGFAGSFGDRSIAAVRPLLEPAGSPVPELMLIGSRGRMLAEAAGLKAAWTTAMPMHVREVADIADRIAEVLYERLAEDGIGRVTLVHAVPDDGPFPPFQTKSLVPFDYARFPARPRAIPPLVTMPPERLLPMLAEEYVFAQLCEALLLSFAAENAARLRAMMAVSTNVREIGDKLASSYRQRRQEVITEEVIELATSAL